MFYHNRVKGHLTLLHKRQQYIREHNECLLQFGIGLGQSGIWTVNGSVRRGGVCVCRVSLSAGIKESKGDGEGKVRELGEIPLGLESVG